MKSFLRAACAALLLLPSFLYAQTLNFSVASATGGATITPRLTWSTVPVATSCTATGGSSGWAGAKGPSGVQTLTAISQSVTYTLACTWPTYSLSVRWTNPTHNENDTPATDDGDPYTDPKGTLLAYGTSASAMSSSMLVNNPTATTATITGLTNTTYYVCAKAMNLSDRLSECSTPPLQKAATASNAVITRTAGLVVVRPNSPTGLQ